MPKDKSLKDCFKCCICKDETGFKPNWAEYTPGGFDDKNNITQLLLCKKCDQAFARAKRKGSVSGLLETLAWAAKRAREAEHRRMAHGLNIANYETERLSAKVRHLTWCVENKENPNAK